MKTCCSCLAAAAPHFLAAFCCPDQANIDLTKKHTHDTIMSGHLSSVCRKFNRSWQGMKRHELSRGCLSEICLPRDKTKNKRGEQHDTA